MNDALFCSVYVNSTLPRDQMALLVVELTSGVAVDGDVDCPWARIAVDDDYGMFEVRQSDPHDFLGWKTLLEIMPPDDAKRDDVVRGVISLMSGLIDRGLRVLAQAEYAEELPGGGEVVPAVASTSS
jgi:hypothetical protein